MSYKTIATRAALIATGFFASTLIPDRSTDSGEITAGILAVIGTIAWMTAILALFRHLESRKPPRNP
jgi:hypothetical protein